MQLTRSATTIGVTCAALASTAFTLNDVGIKFLSGDYPLHQIVFVRTLVALTLTVGLIIPLEGGFTLLKTKHIKMHLLRGLSVVIANMVFFNANITANSHGRPDSNNQRLTGSAIRLSNATSSGRGDSIISPSMLRAVFLKCQEAARTSVISNRKPP